MQTTAARMEDFALIVIRLIPVKFFCRDIQGMNWPVDSERSASLHCLKGW